MSNEQGVLYCLLHNFLLYSTSEELQVWKLGGYMALEAGTRVRLVSDPGRVGVLTGKNRPQAGIVKYQVAFTDGKSFQPDYEIEVLNEDDSDWMDLLNDSRFGRIRDLRRNLTHIHLSGKLANLVYSMDATNTDFYAYQYKPVLSYLESPSKGILIADEVGLGKTIEAGIIWTEIRARFDARRLLVVCPAMLREKWKSELAIRFGISAEILDARELYDFLKKDRQAIPDGKAIICSVQGIRPPKGWNNEAELGDNPRVALAKYLDNKCDEEPIVDMTIIDEAHYMRNPGSQNFTLGKLLRGISDGLVLLSATPVNLSNDDLYYLLNLADPDSFGVKSVFPQVLKANEPLQRARELCLNLNSSIADIRSLLEQAYSHLLLKKNKQLEALLSKDLNSFNLSNKGDRVSLANKIERINLLKNSVTRTRKAEVSEWRVIREPVVARIPLPEDSVEWRFYDGVTTAIRRYAWDNNISDGFLLSVPQRQVSSCMYAAAKAWKDNNFNTSEMVYEDLGYEYIRTENKSPLIREIVRDILPKIDLAELREHDSKYKGLKNSVFDFLSDQPKEKIIVFSYFRNTLHYLHERLEQDGLGSVVLVGGQNEPKHVLIERFKNDPKLRVLLSSEVASEGVDLQFCRVLVNYDLPWNPMKVEQRIGRIDRLGQKSEKINIINIIYENTIDHRIHDKLYQRLKVFERALGGMEAVLGESISELTSDLLTKPLTKSQEEGRIEQASIAIENIRQNQEELENQASHLIAHGGYILDEVNAAHQFKKRITEEDLIGYAKDYLEKYARGYKFHQMGSGELDFEIKLPATVGLKLSGFMKNKQLLGLSKLATGETVMCTFSNKVKSPTDKNEVINQFHPFIRFISDELNKSDEKYYPLIASTVASSLEIGTGIYTYFVSRWEFTGLKHEEELPVRAYDITREKLLDKDDSWALLNHVRVNGRDWLGVENECDLNVLEKAIMECEQAQDVDFIDEKHQRNNFNLDRVNLQITSAESEVNRLLSSREDALSKLEAANNTSMIPAAKGRIAKVKERFEYKVEQLGIKSQLNSSQHEVCCGVIKVN